MRSLYYTRIDMNLDGGLGAVLEKNQVAFSDTMNIGRITAVKHANGRDWWVFVHKAYSNRFYRFLLSPTGLALNGYQDIGIVRPADDGQVCFSPDGTKFAYFEWIFLFLKSWRCLISTAARVCFLILLSPKSMTMHSLEE
jgi:hypothetical protein